MEAGLTDRLWSMQDIAEIIEAAAPKPADPRLTKSSANMFEWIARRRRENRGLDHLKEFPDDQMAVEAILIMTGSLGTKTARHVAENVAGRPLSDDEWNEFGPRWERAWAAIFLDEISN